MANLVLDALPREVVGKKVRFLRRAGWTPGNVYGRGIPSTAIQVRERDFEHILAHTGGSTLLTLNGAGQAPRSVLLQQVKRFPTTGRLEHVDFYQVAELEKLHANVPLHLVGAAEAVTKHDATLLHPLDHLRVECLPGDLPAVIEVDLGPLVDFDRSIHVRDIVAPAGVVILNDPDDLVAKALPPRVTEGIAPSEEAPAVAAEPQPAPEAEKESS